MKMKERTVVLRPRVIEWALASVFGRSLPAIMVVWKGRKVVFWEAISLPTLRLPRNAWRTA